jgi:GMP synthase (glutamine-hydrolysing)
VKKLLILQMRPEIDVADSEFEAILRVTGIDRSHVERIKVDQLKKYQLNLNHYSAIIAGGSPFDISKAPQKKSKIQEQVESFFKGLFDEVVDGDFPFLGACSGSGLLGSYCGATISEKYSEPVGSVTVTKTEAAEIDPLLMDLPRQFTALVGHKEACDKLPPDAVLLLTSESCPVQMFRVKNNVYATQFHPEADAEEFILRINTYKDHGYFVPEKAVELIATLENIKTPIAKIILRRFADKYHADRLD